MDHCLPFPQLLNKHCNENLLPNAFLCSQHILQIWIPEGKCTNTFKTPQNITLSWFHKNYALLFQQHQCRNCQSCWTVFKIDSQNCTVIHDFDCWHLFILILINTEFLCMFQRLIVEGCVWASQFFWGITVGKK